MGRYPGATLDAVLQTLRNLGPMRLAAMGGVAIALIGFFIFISLRISTPDLTLLYRDLDTTDSAAIVQILEEQGVPYDLQQDGGTILVPADQVDRLRLEAASAGLPNGGSIGYEIFDRRRSTTRNPRLRNGTTPTLVHNFHSKTTTSSLSASMHCRPRTSVASATRAM